MTTVLVVEDDPVIADAMAAQLTMGLRAHVSVHGELRAALEHASVADVVVLDLGLRDSDGLQSLLRLRQAAPDVPVLVASARGDLPDRVDGLHAGADDYLVKPFSLAELEARVAALLRRGRRPDASHGALAWDPQARRVGVHGRDIGLTPLEYEIFTVLAKRPGQAVSRSDLLRLVMGPNFYGYERVIDVHIGHLRRKLGDSAPAGWIATVRGFGYRWDGPAPGGFEQLRHCIYFCHGK